MLIQNYMSMSISKDQNKLIISNVYLWSTQLINLEILVIEVNERV